MSGMVIGRLAGRVLRPLTRKVARRYGVSASAAVRVINVAAPMVAGMLAGQWAKHKARRRAAAAYRVHAGKEPPGAIPVRPDGSTMRPAKHRPARRRPIRR
ncbi:hypothetical protein ACGFNU_43145 [Spirillospora sp. NPDC048911]|uniref:hypothetical protein n=1 Tax=Spirillospora sp. NPDC048911 TaxID=3364527 RepID=UPI0037174F89